MRTNFRPRLFSGNMEFALSVGHVSGRYREGARQKINGIVCEGWTLHTHVTTRLRSWFGADAEIGSAIPFLFCFSWVESGAMARMLWLKFIYGIKKLIYCAIMSDAGLCECRETLTKMWCVWTAGSLMSVRRITNQRIECEDGKFYAGIWTTLEWVNGVCVRRLMATTKRKSNSIFICDYLFSSRYSRTFYFCPLIPLLFACIAPSSCVWHKHRARIPLTSLV